MVSCSDAMKADLLGYRPGCRRPYQPLYNAQKVPAAAPWANLSPNWRLAPNKRVRSGCPGGPGHHSGDHKGTVGVNPSDHSPTILLLGSR